MLWKPPRMHILTRCLEFPEVDIDQDKVDDSRAVLFAFFWFEDVAFLQALAVKDFRVDLGEWKLVHTSPLFCQKEFLWYTFPNQKKMIHHDSLFHKSFMAIHDSRKSSDSDLEWRTGVAGSCRKVEGDD